MSYKVIVVEQPARRLVGLSVRLNMRDSQKECPALWEKFMPKMGELAAVAAEEGWFGASANMDEKGAYDYWATMSLPKDANPSDMDCLEAKGGKYAECVVEDMTDIGAAYEYIYGEWGNTQNDYRVDFSAACLEFYDKDWRPEKPITLYVPLQ
jgi:AraC family transcriptional regulator